MPYNKFSSASQTQIPLTNLAEGIFHGPYPEDPNNDVEHYITNRELLQIPTYVSDEQLAADVKTEVQYDMHAESVDQAAEAGRITPEHALYMLEKVLRPWFIGRRNERDIR